MDWNTIQVVVRAVLQGVAGVLVAKGIIDGSGAETIVAALLSLGSVAWSMFHKKQLQAGQ